MELTLDWKNTLYLASQFTGLLIGILVITFGFRKNKANLLLGFSFIFLTQAVFLAWLISSGQMVRFPNIYRTGNIGGLLFAPLMYLYIRRVVRDQSLSWFDLLHAIPAAIYIADYAPVFFLPIEEKSRLIMMEIADPATFTSFTQSRFFPDNFHGLFRTFLISLYWVLSVRLVHRHAAAAADRPDYFGKQWLIWMKVYLAFELLTFLPFYLANRFLSPQLGFDLLHATGALLLFSSGVALLFFPRVLYVLDEAEFILGSQPEKVKPDAQDPLTPEKLDSIRKGMEMALDRNKSFLRHSYSISEFAKDTGVPSYLITLYINHYLKTTFNDLINRRRIEECCQLLETGKYNHLTMEGLAEICGFNNRNSFASAFKRYKNTSPSYYLKNLQKG
jgi:AraC-like DNA-binding protein